MVGTKYLTISETAKKLGVSRRTVYRLVKKQDLEAVEIPTPSGDLRVSITELRRYVKWCQDSSSTRNKLIECPKCGWKF